MKILWLTEFYPRNNETEIIGGVQSRCYYVGKYISQKHNLTVIEGVPKIFAKVSYVSFLIRLFFLPIEIIRSLISEFDLIEASNFSMFFPAAIVAKIKRKPVIFWYPDSFIGSWTKIFGPIGIAGEMMERAGLLIGADHYIAISETVKNKLVSYGVAESKISVIYCGVDFSKLLEVRNKIKSKQINLIAVSRLEKYKSIDLLMSATAVLKKTREKILVKIIGWGRDEQILKASTEKLGMSENIEFLGRIDSHDEVLSIIASSEIMCHPSIVEGFGIVIIESLALGVPVVAANIAVVREITKGSKGVVLFDPGNSADLASKIETLLKNKRLYTTKRREGLALAKNYDYQIISNQTEKLYEQIVQL